MYINFMRVPDNGAIENLSAERLETDPSLTGLRPGRIWYNTTTNQLKFSYTDATDGAVKIAVFLTGSLLDRVDNLEQVVATNSGDIEKNAQGIVQLQGELVQTQTNVQANSEAITSVKSLIGEDIVEEVHKQYPYSEYTKATTVKDMLLNIGKAVADIPVSFSGNVRTTTLDELPENSPVDTSNLFLSGVKIYKGDIVASLNHSSMGLFYVDTARYVKLDLIIEERYGVLEGEHAGMFLVFTSLDTYEFRETEAGLVPEQVLNIHDTMTVSQARNSESELITSVLVGTTAFSFSDSGLELLSPGRWSYVSSATYIDSTGSMYIDGSSFEGKHFSFTYSKVKKDYISATDKGIVYASTNNPINGTTGEWTGGEVSILVDGDTEFLVFILRGTTIKVGYMQLGSENPTELEYDDVYSAQVVGSEVKMTVLSEGAIKFVTISLKSGQISATIVGSISVSIDSTISILSEHSGGKVCYVIVNGELYGIDKTTLSDTRTSTLFRIQRVGHGVFIGDKLIAQTGIYKLGGIL